MDDNGHFLLDLGHHYGGVTSRMACFRAHLPTALEDRKEALTYLNTLDPDVMVIHGLVRSGALCRSSVTSHHGKEKGLKKKEKSKGSWWAL